jgi:hypothetical protein
MSARTERRHRLAAGLGLAGSLLGVVAGLTQATVGDRIPEWTGAKQAPVALGLLTVALSLAAGLAAGWQQRTRLTVGARAACAFGLAGPGLLCLSTVGRLWFLPAVLLLAAAAMTIDSWRDTAAALAVGWWRILLSALGGCELLMSAGAAPTPMVVGALGGAALVAAAWLDHRPRWRVWALVAVGTIPFAALAWTSIVPLILTVEAFAVAAAHLARERAGTRTHQPQL